MIRKNFTIIAKVIANLPEFFDESYPVNPDRTIKDVIVEAIASGLNSQNNNFDWDKFIDACRGSDV